MKKILLVGLVTFLGIIIVGCGEVKPGEKENQVGNKQEIPEEKYFTQEELDKIAQEQNEDLHENIKYRFAKITSIEGTKISVGFLNFEGDYEYKGYNEDLNIDTSKLKETGEKDILDIVGVSTNFTDFNEIKEGVFLRVGNYEKPSNKETSFENGMLLSVDKL